MTVRTKKAEKQDVYMSLVLEVPLRPIRSAEQLGRATEIMDRLLDREALGQDEQDYLDVLSDLVAAYESEEFPIAPVSDGEMLRHLLDAKAVNQVDVSRETGIAESTISEVLAGKRALSRKHIGKLSRFFCVEPGAFNFGS